MAKRTQEQIEKDTKRIQEAAKTATSMQEIVKVTGLSLAQVKKSLSNHPRISKKIMRQLEENQTKANSTVESPKIQEELPEKNEGEAYKYGYVIDTSMVGVDTHYELLDHICATNGKIILTSVVRKELNKMQFVKDDDLARRARRILAMAATRPEKFYDVRIDETSDIPDDNIVKYCVDNRHRVTLLTADKNMTLDAREQHVKVEYYKSGSQEIRIPPRVEVSLDEKGIKTLNPAKKVRDRLSITEMKGKKRDIRVWSNGVEFRDGIVKLRVGDDVFIASQKNYGIAFSHYKVINLSEKFNCKDIFNTKLHSYDEINGLPDERYKDFAKYYWCKIWGER